MNINAFYLISLTFLFFACNNDDDITVPPEDKYLVDIGSYDLLDESQAAYPYNDKTQVQYVDSLGNDLLLTIEEQPQITHGGPSILYRYNVYDPGDTVRYEYRSEMIGSNITNDSLNLEFHVSLEARPYYSDPESEAVADVVNIFMHHPDSSLYASQVFYHVLAQRSWPEQVGGNSTDLETVEFFGKTFDNVLFIEFSDPLSRVHFNYDFGMVAFGDHSGKTWRFEKFIE